MFSFLEYIKRPYVSVSRQIRKNLSSELLFNLSCTKRHIQATVKTEKLIDKFNKKDILEASTSSFV